MYVGGFIIKIHNRHEYRSVTKTALIQMLKLLINILGCDFMRTPFFALCIFCVEGYK